MYEYHPRGKSLTRNLTYLTCFSTSSDFSQAFAGFTQVVSQKTTSSFFIVNTVVNFGDAFFVLSSSLQTLHPRINLLLPNNFPKKTQCRKPPNQSLPTPSLPDPNTQHLSRAVRTHSRTQQIPRARCKGGRAPRKKRKMIHPLQSFASELSAHRRCCCYMCIVTRSIRCGNAFIEHSDSMTRDKQSPVKNSKSTPRGRGRGRVGRGCAHPSGPRGRPHFPHPRRHSLGARSALAAHKPLGEVHVRRVAAAVGSRQPPRQ